MKSYLKERTKNEFEDLTSEYENLFGQWSEMWSNPETHNKLYACYVRLKIVCVLLRCCLECDMIDNITLKTKSNGVSLKNFCNYCIHHSDCVYEDNGKANKNLEVYMVIKTKEREEVAFVINKNIDQISKVITKMMNS